MRIVNGGAPPHLFRQVKPLIRLGEREMAAYCVLRGIDYIVEECPMAAGNKHLQYKEALNAIEAESPGAKHAFYHEFLSKAADRFAPDTAEATGDVGACARCGSPSRRSARRSAGRARSCSTPLPRNSPLCCLPNRVPGTRAAGSPRNTWLRHPRSPRPTRSCRRSLAAGGRATARGAGRAVVGHGSGRDAGL